MNTKFLKFPMRSLMVTLLSVFALVLTAACDDKDDDAADAKTITQIVVDGADFTLLEAAVVRAGLADALSTGSLTVFAPTDAAFRAAGFADVNAINNTPVATLQAVLQYHVIGSKVDRVYLLDDYADEKREAWNKLGDRLEAILSASNVFSLKSA